LLDEISAVFKPDMKPDICQDINRIKYILNHCVIIDCLKCEEDIEPDIEADIMKLVDRRESVALMEPMLVAESSRLRPLLADLALELAQKSAGLRRSLPETLLGSLASLVRAMNCYYSNLIEGHDTHPIDIERALKNDYSEDARKRDLQLEAKAHIRSRNGSTRADCEDVGPAVTQSGRFTPVSATCCRRTCCGWKILRQESGSALFRARCARAT